MAPKAKAPAKAAAKPGAKEAPKKDQKPPRDPVVLRNQIVFFTCAVIILCAVISILVNILDLVKMRRQEQELKDPFSEMQVDVATSFGDDQLRTEEPKEVANAMLRKAPELELNERLYVEMKKQYQELFLAKVLTNDTTPWQFFGNFRYYFSKEDKNWYNAETFCISIGGHLASVLKNEEQTFITSQIQHYSWIGLKNRTGSLLWTDGNTVIKEFWAHARDQPTNSSVHEDCIVMVPTLGMNNWIKRDCYRHFRWVCKERSSILP